VGWKIKKLQAWHVVSPCAKTNRPSPWNRMPGALDALLDAFRKRRFIAGDLQASSGWLKSTKILGGGFKQCSSDKWNDSLPTSHGTNTVRSTWPVVWNMFYHFQPYLGEMIQIDEHIFSDGLVQPPDSKLWCCLWQKQQVVDQVWIHYNHVED